MIYSRSLPALGTERARILHNRFGSPLNLSTTPYGALQTVVDETIFDNKQVGLEASEILFATSTTGDGAIAYQQLRSSTALTVTAAGSAIRQTRARLNYQPRKRQKIEQTFITHSISGDTIVRCGYFDENNGVFFEQTASGLAFVLRSDVSGAVVETIIPRSAWQDQLDGAGPSGYTFETAAAQLLYFDLTWLGVGIVTAGIIWNEEYIPLAKFEHSQLLSSVYMRDPNQSVRWEISSTAGGGELEAICCSVSSEGGHTPLAIPRADYVTGAVAAGSAITEIMSGRLNSDSSATIYPTSFDIDATGNATGVVVLAYNANLTGAVSWRAPRGSGGASSHVEINHTARTAATIADVGHILTASRLAPKSIGSISLTRLTVAGRDVDGTRDQFNMLLINESVNAAVINITVNWLELT